MTNIRFLLTRVTVGFGAWLGFLGTADAASLRVAVASNFVATAERIATEFELATGHQGLISNASTGQLYAQIKQGAPFDVFMAADVERPKSLVDLNLAGQFKVYAHGQLLLLSNVSLPGGCEKILEAPELKHLAIAHPDLAPYGAAAKSFLQQQGWWENNQRKLVMGENIAQAAQLVVTENATAGLLAKSVLINHQLKPGQCLWPVPRDMYAPVKQSMVHLHRSKNRVEAAAFMAFVQSDQGVQIIQSQGYEVSGD